MKLQWIFVYEALHAVIDEVIAFKALSKIKSCTAGSDNILGNLLNKLAGPLTRPLTVLFQQSLFRVVRFEVSVSADTVSAMLFIIGCYIADPFYTKYRFISPLLFKRKLFNTRYQYFFIAIINYL